MFDTSIVLITIILIPPTSVSLSWMYVNILSIKNHYELIIIMSEEPINKKDDLQQDVGDAADNSEIILDEIGDTVKPGPRGVANKMKNTNVDTELENVNLESNGK
jgi:hypothetical protein